MPHRTLAMRYSGSILIGRRFSRSFISGKLRIQAATLHSKHGQENCPEILWLGCSRHIIADVSFVLASPSIIVGPVAFPRDLLSRKLRELSWALTSSAGFPILSQISRVGERCLQGRKTAWPGMASWPWHAIVDVNRRLHSRAPGWCNRDITPTTA